MNDDLKREQHEKLYRYYMSAVVWDIANASYHGKYERESYMALAEKIDEPRAVSDGKTSQQIISNLLDKL